MPILSICVAAENKVWCFRRNSGNFEFTEYSDKWLDTHILIKTDVKQTKKIIDELSYLVGERRFPYIKCVYILRNVLYEMLASSVDINSLRETVSACLVSRQGWRSAN